jgi:hypothetical protein
MKKKILRRFLLWKSNFFLFKTGNYRAADCLVDEPVQLSSSESFLLFSECEMKLNFYLADCKSQEAYIFWTMIRSTNNSYLVFCSALLLFDVLHVCQMCVVCNSTLR